MAKANLTVDPAFLEAFSAARLRVGAAPVDYFTLKVDNSSVVLVGSGAVGDDRVGVFSVISAQAADLLTAAAAAPPLITGAAARPEARIWVVRAPPVGSSVDIAALADAWLVVGFTPEGVHPRAKMLAAAARDDVRRVAGSEHFVLGDFFGTEPSDFAEAAFNVWRSRDSNDAMSTRELAAREVDRTIAMERASLGAATPMRMSLASESFTLDAALTSAIGVFPNHSEAGFVEIRVDGNVLGALTSGKERAGDVLVKLIAAPAAEEPRFWLLRPNCIAGVVSDESAPPLLLVYHCPELAKPKMRMTYSTAKAQLIEALGETGAAVTRTVSGTEERRARGEADSEAGTEERGTRSEAGTEELRAKPGASREQSRKRSEDRDALFAR